MLVRLSEDSLVSSQMPLLTEVAIDGLKEPKGAVNPLLGYGWFLDLLMYKTPLDEIRVRTKTRTATTTTTTGEEDTVLKVDKNGDLLYFAHADDEVDGGGGGATNNNSNGDEKDGGVVPTPSNKLVLSTMKRPIHYLYDEFAIKPLKRLSFTDVWVTEKEWNVLLQLVDWSNLQTFKLHQRNPLPASVLKSFLKYIQVTPNCKLDTFAVQGEGPSATEICDCLDELENVLMRDKTETQIQKFQVQLNQLQNQGQVQDLQQRQEMTLMIPVMVGPKRMGSELLSELSTMTLQHYQSRLAVMTQEQRDKLRLLKIYEHDPAWKQQQEESLQMVMRAMKDQVLQRTLQQMREAAKKSASTPTAEEMAKESWVDPKWARCNYVKDKHQRRRSTMAMINGYVI